MNFESMTYAASGVDIETGDLKVEDMKPLAQSTYRPGVLEGVGGFASLFALNDTGEKLDDPVLVSGADGVGTKLLVAIMAGRYTGLGQDLVAMCANDVLTCGARPLFFLDYFATSALFESPLLEVVSGIAAACKSIGCALVGGETAELPGLYERKHFDLAGFCVGVVNRCRIVDGSKVQPGDAIIGLASSGLHSNGYALARRVVFHKMQATIGDVADLLLEPTRLYVNPVLALLRDQAPIRAMAHITGGGLVGNVPRTLPAGLVPHIDMGSFPRPAIFKLIQENGPVDEDEMERVFNLGIGFTLVVPKSDAPSVIGILTAMGESAMIIGEVKLSN
jgi:phosphoribosylformylglycinamidine cyclo-ligase